MAVAIQASVGTFVQPSPATDIMPVSQITNTHSAVTADDPTATGTVWDAPRVVLGKQATLGATYPLRGPGGLTPFAANAWPMGRVFQSAGWSETIKSNLTTGTLQAGSTNSSLVLATTESTVDDFLLGYAVRAIGSGPSSFLSTSIIRDYIGATRTALLPETFGAAPGTTTYAIPGQVVYALGTLTTPPPVLSISIWRDKKRYDYKDWAPASFAINIPVANDANTSFPDITFSGRGIIQAIVDDVTPSLPSALLQNPVVPARNGKFYLDRVKLGHQNLSFTEGLTVGNASNQNQAAGQDGTDILGGSRTTAIDLNQMAVADFDLHSREDAQFSMPVFSSWGNGLGQNFGFMQPNIALNPFSTGDRNGYVNLTGDAVTTDVDKSATFTIWW